MSNEPSVTPDRRSFLKTVGAAALAFGADRAAAAAAVPAAAQVRPNVRLGLDIYSVGAQQWTPFEQMDFAAKWNVKMVHFSEIRFLGSPDWTVALDPANLRKIRARADELNLDVEIGMRSICPSSSGFDKAAGTAEEQLGRMVDGGDPDRPCRLVPHLVQRIERAADLVELGRYAAQQALTRFGR